MMNPDARQRGLLGKFTTAWDRSQNQVQAAQETFGDLKKFAGVIEGYARQQSFMVSVIKIELGDASKEYPMRSISQGEALALRGDFMAHRGLLEHAKAALEEATRMEPKLPMAHQALGYYLSRKNDLEKADVQAKEAIAEGDASFGAAYLHGMLLARLGAMGDSHKEAVDVLKKATELNPKFAPAFEALAYVYGQSPEEQEQALEAVIAAVKLDPAQHRYLFHLANLLVANGRDADAQHLAQKIVANANSSEEKAEAEALSKRIQEHADWMAA